MKDIPGYEGQYAVTSCGKVWSHKRKKFLKPSLNGDGYQQVTLCKDGKRKCHGVGRLVALAYIPNPKNKPDVNHKDEVRTHNWVNNLEWMTEKENCNYGSHGKRISDARKKAIYCVELDRVFPSSKDAAQELGLNAGNLCSCLKGRYKTCGGYHWLYSDCVDRNNSK